MRVLRQVVAMLAMAVTLAVPACTNVVDGVARPDSRTPGVSVSDDGYGIVAGFPEAPVQLELFTEPQCEHCAHLQAEFGADIKRYLQSGQLAVTYRPLAFLDDQYGNDFSAIAIGALFAAVEPETSAATFQEFVEQLWANQDLALGAYTTTDFADLARTANLPDDVVDRIAGVGTVNGYEVSDANSELLYQLDGVGGTPTGYDLNEDVVIDLTDPDWLTDLMNQSA